MKKTPGGLKEKIQFLGPRGETSKDFVCGVRLTDGVHLIDTLSSVHYIWILKAALFLS